jgi:hypothetical protein
MRKPTASLDQRGRGHPGRQRRCLPPAVPQRASLPPIGLAVAGISGTASSWREILAGGRIPEQNRHVELLNAVGATPGTAAARPTCRGPSRHITGKSGRRQLPDRRKQQARRFGNLNASLSRDIRRCHSPWRWPTRVIVSSVNRVATVESPLTERFGEPGPNQGPTPPDSARPRQTFPDIRAAPNCSNRTQRDAVRCQRPLGNPVGRPGDLQAGGHQISRLVATSSRRRGGVRSSAGSPPCRRGPRRGGASRLWSGRGGRGAAVCPPWRLRGFSA